MPLLNNFVSKNICPSVIEIKFVGIYAVISSLCICTIGKAVIEPPLFNFPARSNNLECR